MLVEITESTLQEVVQFCSQIAKDKTLYGFPRLKDKEDVEQQFLRSLRKQDNKILDYYKDETLVAVLNLLVEPANHYLQAIGGLFTTQNFEEVMELFLQRIKKQYVGYDFFIGFPREHHQANAYFMKKEATLIDASLTMKLEVSDFIAQPKTEALITVTPDNVEKYAIFHDRHMGNIYWNSTRLIPKLDEWYLFYVEDNEVIVGSIFIRKCCDATLEIFGLVVEDTPCKDVLTLNILNQSLQQILTEDSQGTLFFIDESNEAQLQACLTTGFKQIDTYRCYKLSF